MTGLGRAGLDIRLAAVLGIVLVLALGAAAAWAAGSNADLARTRSELAEATAGLATATTGLADAQARLEATTTSLAGERAAIESANVRVTSLEFQIQRKGECIAAQTANLAELRRILAIERSNFDKTTSGSTWGKARAAQNTAIHAAITYLSNAYTSAAAGKRSQANTWLGRSNAQLAASNRQIAVMNREIDRINANTAAINEANDAFAATLDATSSTCGA